ncbi:uncharacterized protein LY89DRAFT_713167 [Mollisia scopiformis]|uniref:Amine oxidase n=1 Tax=Mollisia scopiformis TaxID=149040 RepID=A0A194XVC9_MOLSC|nr:uncharacterized protein LY89DRAFT_713167 [Mollisia scopiformis]KUJ24285.1 hypothetical protein LY89DRAFT_713167 [Mollisia scopiformis]
MMSFPLLAILLTLTSLQLTIASPLKPRNPTCRQTKVAVLGAGTAGITAAQALHNASISDFLIIDVNDYIGGLLHHTNFGKNLATGQPYTIELGTNWSSIQTFDENGAVDYAYLLDDYETAYGTVEQDAGRILKEDLQDRTFRSGLLVADWLPKDDMHKQAAEWWQFDWEYAWPPEQSDENNLCTDPRGFSYWLQSEASTFLTPNDPRVLLSTNITSIDYSAKDYVTITTSTGSCIQASYAICTFSVGVLQNDLVSFTLPLPPWKESGIAQMQMGTYTKIFFQFPPSPSGSYFWETPSSSADTQFFLYADPFERGYYPVWQSLTAPGFLPGSGIIFVTVTAAQAYRAENQDDETVKNEALAVLRSMFGNDSVPEPIHFLYPRWTTTPWAMGSYSNWPPGLSLQMHQNLRANVGRVWFAGEANSVSYFGFLQGAYTEGQYVGEAVAGCVNSRFECRDEPHYEDIKGYTTGSSMLQQKNGWFVDSTSF